MNEQTVLDISTKTIMIAIQIAAPALIAAVLAGLIVSIFQAATQINEQTLSFIPKILVMMITFVICGPWIIKTLIGFTINLYSEIQTIHP